MTSYAGGTRPLAEFQPGRIDYRHSSAVEGSFTHEYDRDLHIIVLWENSRSHEREIKELIDSSFTVLAEYEITWPVEQLETNFNRLYSRALNQASGKYRRVGGGTFLAVVVEDPLPAYAYLQSVSGLVEPTNIHVARLKAEARRIAGPGYTVHSTNSLNEFFHDAALILGPKETASLASEVTTREPVRRCLTGGMVGTEGWRDLTELFEMLRWSTPYVVLRGYEELPDLKLMKLEDIDLLCADVRQFSAVASATKTRPDSRSSRYTCLVGDQRIKVDIREVGDGYYDARWQEEMLRTAVLHADLVRVPSIDNYFFSLLYHAKIQKPNVKRDYVTLLPGLASRVGLPPQIADSITSDETASVVIDGYLAALRYGLPKPIDPGVHSNLAFLNALTKAQPRNAMLPVHERLFRSLRKHLRRQLSRLPFLRALYRRGRSALIRKADATVPGGDTNS